MYTDRLTGGGGGTQTRATATEHGIPCRLIPVPEQFFGRKKGTYFFSKHFTVRVNFSRGIAWNRGYYITGCR